MMVFNLSPLRDKTAASLRLLFTFAPERRLASGISVHLRRNSQGFAESRFRQGNTLSPGGTYAQHVVPGRVRFACRAVSPIHDSLCSETRLPNARGVSDRRDHPLPPFQPIALKSLFTSH